MKRFSQLFAELDQTNKTNDKIAALASYFRQAEPADAAWAMFLLCGRKLRQVIPIRKLCEWASADAEVSPWLFEECYEAVGDLAETISLILPTHETTDETPLHQWIEERLIPLREAEETVQREAMTRYWLNLSQPDCFVLLKLITGGFRVGVSQRLVVRGLAQATQIEADALEHRLTGDWEPSANFYRQLTDANTKDTLTSRPFPFFLAHPLTGAPAELGPCDHWQAEWKWDGIRAQLIRRDQTTHIWSRGDELMTDRFPELLAIANRLPSGTVIDGEILAWKDGVLPFAVMQKRIGRKNLTAKVLADAPVVLMAFDLLEHEGQDVRQRPLCWRRRTLETIVAELKSASHEEDSNNAIQLSSAVEFQSWEQLADLRQTSRRHHTEGLMLKRQESPYGVGRPRGDWWKWKVDPYSVDAVLVYAQRGSGRRAGLYTDYTFAVWNDDELVTFAKAYSGLSDEEITEVDAFVRENTTERFGPVRSVRPQLVFEIAFENIQVSKRHKSGLAVRFPRMIRWRRDKTAEQADGLAALLELVEEKPNSK